MGILLTDKNADYSANAIAYVGISTSVTNGLLSLYDLRGNAKRAAQNNAGNGTTATITGGTFDNTGMTVTAKGQIVFPDKPTNAGENTIAVLLKVKNGGTSSDVPFGSFGLNVTVNGSLYFIHFDRRIQVESTTHSTQSGGSYSANKKVYLDMPVDASLDGTYQLFIATIKSENALTLYRPANSTSSTVALTAGQFAYYNQNARDNNFQALANGATAHTLGLFAHWNRVLTASEIGTFYNEMKSQYAKIGVTI